MIYIHHSYNKTIHTFNGRYSFETFFGYLPPSHLNVVYGQQGRVREDTTSEALRAENFIDKIMQINLQVQKKLKS